MTTEASELKRQLFAMCELGACPECGRETLTGDRKAASLVCSNCGQRWSVELNGIAWGEDLGGGTVAENGYSELGQRA